MARLEAAHRRLDIGIEHRAVAGLAGDVAGDDQPLAQRRDRGPIGAESQLHAGRQAGPPAIGDDLLILPDRLLGRRDRLGRQDRRRRTRHGEALGGVIALRPFRLTVVRIGEGYGHGGQQRGEHAPKRSARRRGQKKSEKWSVSTRDRSSCDKARKRETGAREGRALSRSDSVKLTTPE